MAGCNCFVPKEHLCKREGFGQGERKYFSPLVFRSVPIRKGIQRRHRGKPWAFPLKRGFLSKERNPSSAEGGSRTPKRFLSLAPEASAFASFTTSANFFLLSS